MTVLAADGAGHYAFHRGTVSLKDRIVERKTPARQKPAPTADYLGNRNERNRDNLVRNSAVLEKGIWGNDQKGVQVQQAK